MKTKPFLTTSLLLVTILAFVYFAQPIYAKANSSDMDYVTTSMSSNEVAQLFTGVEAFIPAAVIIIGFIVMMYCTLRNIDTPIDFSSQQSFFDKCQSLGQFMINNISDDVKDFFYSVYTYCQDNNITSVTGMAAFVAKNAAMFFSSIGKWIGTSLLSGRSQNGTDLLNQFITSLDFTFSYIYSYSDQFSSVFNSYSSISYESTIGTFSGNYWGNYNSYYDGYSLVTPSPFILVFPQSNRIDLYFYTLDSSGLNIVPTSISYKTCHWRYSDSKYGNVPPDRTEYSSVSWSDYTSNFISLGLNTSGNPTYYPIDLQHLKTFLSSLTLLGSKVAQVNSVPVSSIPVSDLPWVNTLDDVINPAVDTYYGSTDDQVAIDVVGVAGALGALAAIKAQGGSITAIDKIQAYVGDIGLTLESAIPQDVVVDNAGNYHFPNLDGIWKYPRYFFEMLKGWGSFVGGCLNAVTVGEGGLSWIFYGGFIILICGGVVGKIILG